MGEKLAPTQRHRFVANGQLVYEWDQTLNDVNMYVPVPEGTKAKSLYCRMEATHVEIGLAPNPPYLSEKLCDRVVVSESLWTLEDGVMNVSLQKAQPGETWKGVFERHALDERAVEEDKKRLLLERFQEEHAGFDFSGAEVSGTAPNPRTFLKDDPEIRQAGADERDCN